MPPNCTAFVGSVEPCVADHANGCGLVSFVIVAHPWPAEFARLQTAGGSCSSSGSSSTHESYSGGASDGNVASRDIIASMSSAVKVSSVDSSNGTEVEVAQSLPSVQPLMWVQFCPITPLIEVG